MAQIGTITNLVQSSPTNVRLRLIAALQRMGLMKPLWVFRHTMRIK
jgi:hypothetical protein